MRGIVGSFALPCHSAVDAGSFNPQKEALLTFELRRTFSSRTDFLLYAPDSNPVNATNGGKVTRSAGVFFAYRRQNRAAYSDTAAISERLG